LEYKYGLGREEWGLLQLLHPELSQVTSLYVGPAVPFAEWQRVGTRVLVERGQFPQLLDRVQREWWEALSQLSPEERGFREYELRDVQVLTLRGFFYQTSLYPEERAVERGSGSGSERRQPAKPGDPCACCPAGHIRWGGLKRFGEICSWTGRVEHGRDEFED
jgi:hypothetical protein